MKHAFWRRPDTTLHKSDDARYAPTALLSEIGTRSTVNKDGSISWPLFELDQLQFSVNSSIGVLHPDGRELNETDTVELVKKSLNETIMKNGGGNPILPKVFLSTVNKKAADLFRKEMKNWLLVTSLSVKGFNKFPLEVFSTQIKKADRKTFPFPKKLVSYPSYLSRHIEKSEYEVVSVECEALTIHHAFDSCVTAINLLRGIWNLLATFRSNSIGWSHIPKRKWIGVIHASPIYSFHNPDGSLQNDLHWYEPDYVEDAKPFFPKMGWSDFWSNHEYWIEKISISPFENELVDILARYALALDQSNLDVTFLMLWSLLEKITNTVGGNYDETIRRVIRPFSDRTIAKQHLNQMRRRRNQFVHSAGSTSDRDKLCYITKNFVDQHMIQLIRNDYRVNSLSDYGDFLGLPHDENQLIKMRDWYQRAIDLNKFSTDENADPSRTATAPTIK